MRIDVAQRARAASIHLLISIAITGLVAALVFGLWYPGVYSRLASGRELFLLLTAVDVILGPLLTLAVFNRAKGWAHLRRDLATIGLIQVAALGYGLHAVFVVRPIALVLEGKRFRVVSAKDVAVSELPEARPEYRSLPITGPWLLGTRLPKSNQERGDTIFKALDGTDVGQRPSFWQPYSESKAGVLAGSRPLGVLLARYEDRRAELRTAIQGMKTDVAAARFVPVIARGDWSVVIDASGRPVGFLPVNGFF